MNGTCSTIFLNHALASYMQNVCNKYFVVFAVQFVLSVQLLVIKTEHLLYCVNVQFVQAGSNIPSVAKEEESWQAFPVSSPR